MTDNLRTAILRANATFLSLGAVGGLRMDIQGAFFGEGPAGRLLGHAPGAAIGMIEAHGLALIVSILLWRAAPLRHWHLAAASVHILLGTANLVFWQFFIAADAIAMGYVTTSLHWLFFALEISAASGARDESRALPA